MNENYKGPGNYKDPEGELYRIIGLSKDTRTKDLRVIYLPIHDASEIVGFDFYSCPLDEFELQLVI